MPHFDDLEDAGRSDEMTAPAIDHDTTYEEEEEIESEEAESGGWKFICSSNYSDWSYGPDSNGMGEQEVIQGSPYTKTPNADRGLPRPSIQVEVEARDTANHV